MGVLQAITKALQRLSGGDHPLVLTAPQYGSTVDANTLDNADLALSTVWSYAAIRAIATYAANTFVRAYTLDETHLTTLLTDDDPIQKMVYKPNKFQTWNEFVEANIFYMNLFGHTLIHLARSPENPDIVGSMAPMRPDKSEIVASKDPNEPIRAWKFFPSDGSRNYQDYYEIPAKDVLVIRHFSPTDPILGMAPSTPGRLSLLADLHSSKFNVSFFGNSAMPGVILQTDKLLTRVQRKRLSAGWRAAFGGSTRAHGVAVLTAGLKVQTVTPSHKEMAFEGLRALAREEILAAWGVPPAILGLTGQTYAGAEVQRHTFLTGTLQPQLNLFLTKLTEHVFDPMGAFLQANYESFLTTTKTLHERRLETRGFWRDGIITRNEAREALGFDPIDPTQGDVFIDPSLAGTSAPVPVGDVDNPVDVPTDLPAPFPVDDITRKGEVHRSLLATADSARLPYVQVFGDIFRDQSQAVREAARAAGKRAKARAGRLSFARSLRYDRRWIDRALSRAYDTHTDDVRDLYEGVYSGMYRNVGTVMKALSRPTPDESIFFARQAAERLKGLLSSVTKRHVITALEDLPQDASPEELDLTLTRAFDRFLEARVRTIARTEPLGAANAGAFAAYKATGVARGIWMSIRDGRGRPSHAEAHLQERPLGTPFEVGKARLLYPHDPAGAVKDIVACRCGLVPADA